ncbi:MAG: ParA family protein, partial [Actinomycetota bacterium]
MTATVHAVANQKGGVGKTTTTLNVASAMSELGAAVLVVDLDPQGCLTFSLGYDPDAIEPSLNDTVVGRSSLAETIIQHDEVDLAPSNIDLAGAEVTLLSRTGREYLLRGQLAELLDSYDAILIDCPPSLGVLTINGLTAADQVVIPVQCETLSHRGVAQLLETIEDVRRLTNRELDIRGVVATLFDARTRHSWEVLAYLLA